ncbi:acyltransferase [Azospirillum brasilense]|uniref:acyltransferase n=1 Tax=Azospirillum brasilense TaxID=192 RepID=UPI000E6A54C0|nr:acyltransferase [Azospirillum brasilense]NUB27728.1 hypothetical protein [Azospirillum brasilense]NUB35281.1 hypothetical protein [Azospirillum brasilense]RIV97406.1 hypothetical protein D2T81_28790 [Azospirillum brasilense]
MIYDDEEYTARAVDVQPWIERSQAVIDEQEKIHNILRKRSGAKIGANCFIAKTACVYAREFSIGDNSWIAHGAIIRESVKIGQSSSINAYCHIAGNVSIGSYVMIASMVSIYGFNHGHERIDVPMRLQPITAKGVIIEDDVWIGANAVILDGCRIGAHSIVSAGAIVTKSFPSYSVIGGNPARIIKTRTGE